MSAKSTAAAAATDEATESSTGIPACQFIEDVAAYLHRNGDQPVQEAIKDAEELYNKYKFMEQHFSTRRSRLRRQIPDLSNNLNAIEFLKSRQSKEFTTSFMLADNVYAKANVADCSKVGVWLGANVMLEYDLTEAEALLKKNLDSAETNLAELEKNLDFIKDQITTSEVNIARLYNHGVMLTKQARLTGAEA
ncbi:hypothetical protein BOX15_Mlig008434g2 [Macrostomum lignano]|uniref:Prefoldin subunit 3 n=1 Tax=Macrostomum lignano TaxID=282301 RepID=A0A267F8L0_9PLAT|nr:hypothetical protein BOX15_Mlig008434g2 [Macrostomum lignano]